MLDFSWTSNPDAWIGLLTLIILELVLGIDNIIFISILSAKLPPEQREKARNTGIGLAIILRLGLLSLIGVIVQLKKPLFTVKDIFGTSYDWSMSGKQIILLLGGLFLIWKSVKEIHAKLEGDDHNGATKQAVTFAAVVGQIVAVDLVFSVDSVITAVGMVSQVSIMVIAVLVSVGFILKYAGAISAFVEKHPTVKMLALAFLIMIGVSLVSEAFGYKIEKGFIYFSMAFSVCVEMLNIKLSAKKKAVPVHLKSSPQEIVDAKFGGDTPA
jgi:predicted tellurium resistance membrane protein TerC